MLRLPYLQGSHRVPTHASARTGPLHHHMPQAAGQAVHKSPAAAGILDTLHARLPPAVQAKHFPSPLHRAGDDGGDSVRQRSSQTPPMRHAHKSALPHISQDRNRYRQDSGSLRAEARSPLCAAPSMQDFAHVSRGYVPMNSPHGEPQVPLLHDREQVLRPSCTMPRAPAPHRKARAPCAGVGHAAHAPSHGHPHPHLCVQSAGVRHPHAAGSHPPWKDRHALHSAQRTTHLHRG